MKTKNDFLFLGSLVMALPMLPIAGVMSFPSFTLALTLLLTLLYVLDLSVLPRQRTPAIADRNNAERRKGRHLLASVLLLFMAGVIGRIVLPRAIIMKTLNTGIPVLTDVDFTLIVVMFLVALTPGKKNA